MKRIISKGKVNGILKKLDFAMIFFRRGWDYLLHKKQYWWQVSQKLINVEVLMRHVARKILSKEKLHAPF